MKPTISYDINPAHRISTGIIASGFDALAEFIAQHSFVIIDGYVGIHWDRLRDGLDAALSLRGLTPAWLDATSSWKTEQEIENLVAPFLGGDDPLFGTRTTLSLVDLINRSELGGMGPVSGCRPTILYGPGAALTELPGVLIYADLPKQEVQLRSRSGHAQGLGCGESRTAGEQYKRFYFVDWVLLDRHKKDLVQDVDVFLDGRRPDEPRFLDGDSVRNACKDMARSFFRTRPWFEPGPWGGQWMKQRIAGLNQSVPNYAWSFELITPENGLLLSDDERDLEISFDWLMYLEHRAVLGEAAEVFGYEFPIRFDYLDTYDGGNLSIQCHPGPEYIRTRFGESFTQDESYYILDCKPEARVYLGFVQGVDPDELCEELDRVQHETAAADIDRFVNSEPARKHDFFLIPHGTVHGAGKDNMVLEISATPYIFTFKMYDWQRMSLDGRPRPLNLARAMENLRFELQGRRVNDELVSRPVQIRQGKDWNLLHLPTHADHFYDVHRWEFDSTVEISTAGSCQVMNLVEGDSVVVESQDGRRRRFHYAETFVIPAAAETVRLINEGVTRARVVSAFIKRSIPESALLSHPPVR